MTDLILPRRKFLTGLVGLIAAPAIVRAASLMPVKVVEPAFDIYHATNHWWLSETATFPDYAVMNPACWRQLLEAAEGLEI